jgi:hypothetical protein
MRNLRNAVKNITGTYRRENFLTTAERILASHKSNAA